MWGHKDVCPCKSVGYWQSSKWNVWQTCSSVLIAAIKNSHCPLPSLLTHQKMVYQFWVSVNSSSPNIRNNSIFFINNIGSLWILGNIQSDFISCGKILGIPRLKIRFKIQAEHPFSFQVNSEEKSKWSKSVAEVPPGACEGSWQHGQHELPWHTSKARAGGSRETAEPPPPSGKVVVTTARGGGSGLALLHYMAAERSRVCARRWSCLRQTGISTNQLRKNMDIVWNLSD